MATQKEFQRWLNSNPLGNSPRRFSNVADRSRVDPRLLRDIAESPRAKFLSSSARAGVQTALGQAEHRQKLLREGYVELPSGEFVASSEYRKLPLAHKRRLRKLGVEEFEKWVSTQQSEAQKVWETENIKVGEDLWVSKAALPMEEQKFLKQPGVDVPSWREKFYVDVDPTAGEEWFGKASFEELPEEEQTFLTSKGQTAWEGKFYERVGPKKELIKKDWWKSLSAEDRSEIGKMGFKPWLDKTHVEIGPEKELVRESWYKDLPSAYKKLLETHNLEQFSKFDDANILLETGEWFSKSAFEGMPTWLSSEVYRGGSSRAAQYRGQWMTPWGAARSEKRAKDRAAEEAARQAAITERARWRYVSTGTPRERRMGKRKRVPAIKAPTVKGISHLNFGL